MNHLLELRFSTCREVPVLEAGELVMVEVRIKIDNEHIELLPKKMVEMLRTAEENQLCPVSQWLREYKGEHINFIVVYYGEYNFDLIRKKHY